MLTNGGGIPEEERASLIQTIVKPTEQLTKDHMILCHTPFRDLVPKYADQFVIVSGLGRMLDVAHLYGFKKAVDILEVFAVFPEVCPAQVG